MVGLKRCIVALSVVYLTLTIIAIHADAANNFCATAIDKPLCEKMVKGAANWNEAITKAITGAMSELAKASQSGIPACKDAYKDTQNKLTECLTIAKSGDKDGSLNIKLSAASTSIDDCGGVVKDPAKKKLNTVVGQAIKVCLAVEKSKSAI